MSQHLPTGPRTHYCTWWPGDRDGKLLVLGICHGDHQTKKIVPHCRYWLFKNDTDTGSM